EVDDLVGRDGHRVRPSRTGALMAGAPSRSGGLAATAPAPSRTSAPATRRVTTTRERRNPPSAPRSGRTPWRARIASTPTASTVRTAKLRNSKERGRPRSATCLTVSHRPAKKAAPMATPARAPRKTARAPSTTLGLPLHPVPGGEATEYQPDPEQHQRPGVRPVTATVEPDADRDADEGGHRDRPAHDAAGAEAPEQLGPPLPAGAELPLLLAPYLVEEAVVVAVD